MPDADYRITVLPLDVLFAPWCSSPNFEGSLIITNPELAKVCRCELNLWEISDLRQQINSSALAACGNVTYHSKVQADQHHHSGFS